MASRLRLTAPLVLIGLSVGLAVWLGVAGPRAVRREAADASVAEQELLAHQGAARIEARLGDVARWLGDPLARRSSDIEGAGDDETRLREALGQYPRQAVAGLDVVLFVVDADGRTLAVEPGRLGAMEAEFLGHRHLDHDQPWTAGAGVCPMCLDHMHQVSVASPLGAGRLLMANVGAESLARSSLESLFAEPGRAAWLRDARGSLVGIAGLDAAPAEGDPAWLIASASLSWPAAGWEVSVAADKGSVGERSAAATTRLLALALGVGLLLVLAAALTVRAQRRRHERELAEWAALAHQDKLATLGMMTAGVGHELRNVLTVVSGNLQLAEEYGAESPELRALLDDASAAADRLAAIADGLRTFGRRDDARPMAAPLRSAIEEAVRFVAPIVKRGPTIEVVYEAEPTVRQVRGQLSQVVVNLLRNAADAMSNRPEGVIRVVVSNGSGAARVTVEDEGDGLPASVERQLFTPFFTTKPPETGTGLGLSVCADIVARHGGRIRGENRGDRRGARFVVELPVS